MVDAPDATLSFFWGHVDPHGAQLSRMCATWGPHVASTRLHVVAESCGAQWEPSAAQGPNWGPM